MAEGPSPSPLPHSQPPPPQTTPQAGAARLNAFGAVGFLISLLGVLMTFCFVAGWTIGVLPWGGIVGLIGLAVSIIGFARQPRGLAIAGAVLGLFALVAGIVLALRAGGVTGAPGTQEPAGEVSPDPHGPGPAP
jgi:hypothetical protein